MPFRKKNVDQVAGHRPTEAQKPERGTGKRGHLHSAGPRRVCGRDDAIAFLQLTEKLAIESLSDGVVLRVSYGCSSPFSSETEEGPQGPLTGTCSVGHESEPQVWATDFPLLFLGTVWRFIVPWEEIKDPQ